jgi:hypothetical protein
VVIYSYPAEYLIHSIIKHLHLGPEVASEVVSQWAQAASGSMKKGDWQTMKLNLKLIVLFALLACGTTFARGRVFIGIGGPVGYGYGYAPYAYAAPLPPPLPYYAAYPAPVYANPGYNWVNGYWHWGGAAWGWRPGYWARPPYVGARWIAPRYFGGRYYTGYWRR